ncbi:flagellar assembly protein FliW [Paenibacillus qinlingensis]|uniref:Flagellar assembly factor FliW n=1 Tax=Paenibacillus qinlingensis TaxID=1837343 RepID=A0ABU1P1I5_9BACL|nr:flagellar assembly protein FliW [Paenibacillus qinlingensis]MDR6553606.1 flagellar assembly factor FliW [Paenibacillus qinlingensis]
MILDTLSLGQLTYEEEDIITFIQGIPGFEDLHKYLIIESNDHEAIVYLQSIEDSLLHFAMLNPFYVYMQYEFELEEADREELAIQAEEDVAVWSLVTMHEDVGQTTINLLAPIILNKKGKKAKQVVLHKSEYRTKHRLIELMQVST